MTLIKEKYMKKSAITLIAVAIGLTFSASGMAQTMSNHEYKSGLDRIQADFKSDKSNCQTLSGNANEICMAEANGKEKVARADLDARNKNTESAYYDARIAKAEADYSVSTEKCNGKAGNDKDVCLKEATAAEVAAKADAKAQMKTSKAYNNADEKSAKERDEAKATAADAQHGADEDKRDADYAVAKEKCNSFAGSTKESCVNEAKMHYGKM